MADAVALFFALSTQWIWVAAGLAGAFRSGINYCAIAPTAEGLSIKLTPDVFSDIRVMELEALTTWSKKRG